MGYAGREFLPLTSADPMSICPRRHRKAFPRLRFIGCEADRCRCPKTNTLWPVLGRLAAVLRVHSGVMSANLGLFLDIAAGVVIGGGILVAIWPRNIAHGRHGAAGYRNPRAD